MYSDEMDFTVNQALKLNSHSQVDKNRFFYRYAIKNEIFFQNQKGCDVNTIF